MWKKELRNNKKVAVALLVVSLLPVLVFEEGIMLVFCFPISLILFFSKENWITL